MLFRHNYCRKFSGCADSRRKLARIQAGDVGSNWGDGEMMKVDSRSMTHRAGGRVPRTRLMFSCLANLFPYPRNAGAGSGRQVREAVVQRQDH